MKGSLGGLEGVDTLGGNTPRDQVVSRTVARTVSQIIAQIIAQE